MTAANQGGRILYLTHNGLTEPLGRRQVLPYLEGLSRRGWRFSVVSFEKGPTAIPTQRAAVERIVGKAGIEWRPLRYHNRPPLLATAWDVLQGWYIASRIAGSVDLIHARSTVPALMARIVAGARRRGYRLPWVFDVRGLVADEYVDAGHWAEGSIRQLLTSRVERRLLGQADGIVTLTRQMVDLLPLRSDSGPATTVIPCCVDLESFRPSDEWRFAIRSTLGLGDAFILVYSGSLGSWYRLDEMLDFYQVASRAVPSLHFLLLTPQAAMAARAADARGLSSRVTPIGLEPDEVPRYLAAADAGICFLGRHGSKVASSPTKYGEYLAAGLPVITNGWIGDAARLAGEKPWILVDDFSESAYANGAARLAQLLVSRQATQGAARSLARREFALEEAVDRYDALYRRVLDR